MVTAAKKRSAPPARKRSAPAAKKAAQPAAARSVPAAADKPAQGMNAPNADKPSKALRPGKPKADKPKADKPSKADKPKKPKLVRDSFTIPKGEYAVLQVLKDRAAKAGSPAKKSELLRAGIQALAGMQDGAFLAALAAVPTLKTGRPAKG